MEVDPFIKLSLKISVRRLIENCYINFGCSIVGKPLCYHSSDPGLIPRGSHTTRSLLTLLGQLSLPSFRGR